MPPSSECYVLVYPGDGGNIDFRNIYVLYGAEAQNTIIDHQLPRRPGKFVYLLYFLGKVAHRKNS